MNSPLHAVFFCLALLLAPAARAVIPEHTEENGIIKITGAGPDNPTFVGGSCTTIASAWLTDASIAESIIVFQIDGGG